MEREKIKEKQCQIFGNPQWPRYPFEQLPFIGNSITHDQIQVVSIAGLNSLKLTEFSSNEFTVNALSSLTCFNRYYSIL